MKKINILMLVVLVLHSHFAYSKINRSAQLGDHGMNLYWWPELPNLKGWYQDIKNSYHYGINIQVPDGFTFSNSETIIYVKAVYKEKVPNLSTLREFIKNDIHEFNNQKISIKKDQPLKIKNGTKLKSYTFFPAEKGNWERVSYGEADDFYLVFTLSARSKKSYLETIKIYEDMIARYE